MHHGLVAGRTLGERARSTVTRPKTTARQSQTAREGAPGPNKERCEMTIAAGLAKLGAPPDMRPGSPREPTRRTRGATDSVASVGASAAATARSSTDRTRSVDGAPTGEAPGSDPAALGLDAAATHSWSPEESWREALQYFSSCDGDAGPLVQAMPMAYRPGGRSTGMNTPKSNEGTLTITPGPPGVAARSVAAFTNADVFTENNGCRKRAPRPVGVGPRAPNVRPAGSTEAGTMNDCTRFPPFVLSPAHEAPEGSLSENGVRPDPPTSG